MITVTLLLIAFLMPSLLTAVPLQSEIVQVAVFSPSPTTIKLNVDSNKLLSQAPTLNKKVLKRALSIYRCALKKGAKPKAYLTLIDFTKPSSKKRLWVLDLKRNKVIYHTWVAHGVHSGLLYATAFSNKPKSRQSSIGLIEALETYTGEHGTSLRLKGREHSFNSEVLNRHIVMHSAWYVGPDFINKYGRIGRSWGCPAISEKVSHEIISTIHNKSYIILYYPEKKWLNNSSYLTCD